jgi:hypothetical protein
MVMAPQVGLEPTTLRLTADLEARVFYCYLELIAIHYQQLNGAVQSERLRPKTTDFEQQ